MKEDTHMSNIRQDLLKTSQHRMVKSKKVGDLRDTFSCTMHLRHARRGKILGKYGQCLM